MIHSMSDDMVSALLILAGGILLAVIVAVVPFKRRRPKYPEFPTYDSPTKYGGGGLLP